MYHNNLSFLSYEKQEAIPNIFGIFFNNYNLIQAQDSSGLVIGYNLINFKLVCKIDILSFVKSMKLVLDSKSNNETSEFTLEI